MLKRFILGCFLLVAFTHCVQPVKTVKIHPNCPEIPATTFEKVGLDAKAGALQFGKLVTVGEFSVISEPGIISGISQSVRDDQITDTLICAARERGELKTNEQIAHAWKVARYYRTNPTAAEAMEFHKQHPFPATSGKQENPDQMLSQLVVEGVNDPFSIVPQGNQPLNQRPKVTKFARIKVINNGHARIKNLRLIAIKVNGRDGRFQLPVSSIDTLFERLNPSPPQISVDLNPGDDEYFDAVIECNGRTYNGTTCTKGTLAIPFIDNGNRLLVAPVEQGVERLDEFTVRASADMGSAVTRTFRVNASTEGHLVLQVKEQ